MLNSGGACVDERSVVASVVREEEFSSLLSRAQRGEREAIERLFTDLQPRLLRYFRMTARHDAEDLAGEVWMGVARGFGEFSGDLDSFRGWVFTIAHRRLSDHRRRAARRVAEEADERALSRQVSGDDPEHGAIERLSGQDAAQLVARLLPQDQADVVLLRVVGDVDVRDVARIMGRSENWVRVAQHRGLRRLAERLGDKTGVMG